MTALITLAAVLAITYFFGFCYRGASWPKTVIKTLSVALLAMVVFAKGGPLLLGLALSFCAAGDYLLSRDTEGTFLAGVGAFASGHLLYAAAFLTHSLADPNLVLTSGRLPLVIGLTLFGIGMAVALFARAGSLRFAVMGYIPIILSMAVAALVLPAVGPLGLILPAALLFLLSDTVLASEEFLLPDGHVLHRITPFIVWPTYWLAQFGFFLGLFWFPMT
mgnify:CR=1 FL=1